MNFDLWKFERLSSIFFLKALLCVVCVLNRFDVTVFIFWYVSDYGMKSYFML